MSEGAAGNLGPVAAGPTRRVEHVPVDRSAPPARRAVQHIVVDGAPATGGAAC
jgi:hypothetical protein